MDDPAKKRRQYLRKNVGGLSLAYACGLCSTAAGLLTPLLLLGAMFADNCMDEEDGAHKPQIVEQLVEDYPFLVPVAFGSFALGTGLLCRLSFKKTKALPYVPPVAEQLAALRAEEVLVRSSDEPAASADELLRAAREAAATDTDELLRAESRTA